MKNIELVLLVYKKSEIDYKGHDTTLWLLKHGWRHPIPSLAHWWGGIWVFFGKFLSVLKLTVNSWRHWKWKKKYWCERENYRGLGLRWDLADPLKLVTRCHLLAFIPLLNINCCIHWRNISSSKSSTCAVKLRKVFLPNGTKWIREALGDLNQLTLPRVGGSPTKNRAHALTFKGP